jgi:hypothetical protein
LTCPSLTPTTVKKAASEDYYKSFANNYSDEFEKKSTDQSSGGGGINVIEVVNVSGNGASSGTNEERKKASGELKTMLSKKWGYRRGSVPNLNRAIGGANLALGHYSAGTAVQGDIPLPKLETSYEGAESVDTLPTYQEVLFLIRVK